MARGADFYQQGRYIDADQLFEHAEPQLPRWNGAERVRYSLYRGLTYLALGDVALARRWLSYGATIDAHLPITVPSAERELLAETLREVSGPAAPPNTAATLNATSTGAATAPKLVPQAVWLSVSP